LIGTFSFFHALLVDGNGAPLPIFDRTGKWWSSSGGTSRKLHLMSALKLAPLTSLYLCHGSPWKSGERLDATTPDSLGQKSCVGSSSKCVFFLGASTDISGKRRMQREKNEYKFCTVRLGYGAA
jgi:hypothetical protein